ncbi:MAG: hypothetical protein GY845_11520 [Planctomycetes bacterium]|nr:hypothetical protein [Planctomycetota bacterium]
MKFQKGNNQILWALVLIAVLAAILIYRTGFHRPVPGFDEEKMKSLGLQETEAGKKKAEPSSSVNTSESIFQPSQAVEHTWELQKEPRYGSENPLYFCVALGEDDKKSMLGVVDESGGTGAGYDVAYVDENMNGDLKDEAVKQFPRRKRGSRAGELEPRFEFTGPFKGEEKARYTLYIYSLTRKTYNRPPGNDYYFHWYLDIKGWNYFFINGRMALFSNAADAMKSEPVRLGGQCKWEIGSGLKDGRPVISAGLKDGNGCTLRILSGAGGRKSPRLTLIRDGKVRAEENMKFG